MYDSRDNSNAIIETSTNTLILGCKNTVIPNSVTSIGDCAFVDCSDLTSITIPDSVTTIGWATFANCNGLTTVTLPKAVKEIGRCAFRDCTGITTINVPVKKTDYYKKRLPENLHQFIVEMEPVKKAKKK